MKDTRYQLVIRINLDASDDIEAKQMAQALLFGTIQFDPKNMTHKLQRMNTTSSPERVKW